MSVLERPKKWIDKARGWAVSTAFGISGIVTLVAAMSTKAIDGNFFLAFVAIGITGFIATLIHEIGHAWVAKRRGAEVKAIAALPLVYFPRFRKLTFESERRTGDIGGYVTYSFPEDCGTRRDEIAIAAAGPAWNLLSAGLCILALWAAPQIPWHVEEKTEAVAIKADQVVQEGQPTRLTLPTDEEIAEFMEEVNEKQRAAAISSLITSLAQIFIVVSITSGVLNLLPYRGSDGAIILEHWRWLKKLS